MHNFEFVEQMPYTAEQMFDLVASVDLYYEFMPLCERSFVIDRQHLSDGSEQLLSVLEVAHKKSGLRNVLESKVHLDRDKLEILALSDKGPIKYMKSVWRFRDLDAGGSEAHFRVEYQMNAMPLQMLMGKLYRMIFERISTAFRDRAKVIYGPSTAG
jgi:coenzyme Q-binding protein COQ10